MAGSRSFGNGGDGGAATSAQLHDAVDVAVDNQETIFIADQHSSRIRMVTRAGIITTYAGISGSFGSSGDNGVATSAQLNQPQGVAVDVTSGSVYIADTNNYKIRVVTSNGIITTFAGSNVYSNHNVYDCDATSAKLVTPKYVAVDRLGNVYIGTTDSHISGGHQVLVVTHGTGYITLFAGCDTSHSCSGWYGDPAINFLLDPCTGLAVDVNLNVYIATVSKYSSNNQVALVQHTTGIITLFAGSYSGSTNGDGGPATIATISYPSGIAIDMNGTVYIADQQNNNVRRVANGTGIITTYVGGNYNGAPNLGDGGLAISASLYSPNGLAVDTNGNLFIADLNDYRIRKVAITFNYPTSQPTVQPSKITQPSAQPTRQPSSYPTMQPSLQPSMLPSLQPTCQPTMNPSTQPSTQPSSSPSGQPSRQPSMQPSEEPSKAVLPTTQPTSQ